MSNQQQCEGTAIFLTAPEGQDRVRLILRHLSPEMATTIISVLEEYNRACIKHPTWPECNVKRAAIVAEEAGELIREANQIDEGKGSIYSLKEEAIQTASTALRMVMVLSEGGDHV